MKDLCVIASVTMLLPFTAAIGAKPPVAPPVPPERFSLKEQDLDPKSGAMESQYNIGHSSFYGYWAKRQRRIRLLYCWEEHLGPYRTSNGFLAPLPEPGEVLPIFGCLYRVDTGPEGKSDRESWVFSKLMPGETPEDMQVQRAGTYIVPLQKHGYGETWSRFSADQGSVRFRCHSIEATSQKRADLAARLEAWVSVRKPNSRLSQSKTMQFSVREGDTYSLRTGHRREKYHKFTVVRIVPRDEKQKTMGWVELSLAWKDALY
jgi:hypothetical protein